ncbi:MAG TPA: hypothetical protein VEH04_20550 [Verrucomicrobiae bacterium]|nr:hypothetical protein [Verrucomicrobiae bacterium]
MPKHQLGILLVHGIGTQPSGESLIHWGDALLKTIRLATHGKVPVTVKTATSERGHNNDTPASAIVSLQLPDGEQTWLIADGWWADVFLPPSYKELVSWSGRALPWAIALHIAQSHWQLREQKGWRKAWGVAVTVLKLLAALVLAPVFVFGLAISLVIGALPIPQLRAFLMAAQGTLISTVGDSLVFVESPIRAALIRTRLREDLKWLKTESDKTMIVAHSQGAAVVLDALGAIRDPEDESFKTADASSESNLVPDTLVTFGAGTNQLTCLKKLATGMPRRLGFNPVNCAMGAMLVSCAIILGLGVSVLQQHTTVRMILIAVGALGACLALVISIAMAGRKAIASLGKKFAFIRQHEQSIVLNSIVFGMLALIGLAIYAAQKTSLPLFSVSLFYYDLILLLAGVYLVLSEDMRKAVTLVSMPAGLGHWFDFYASADPVPNGPTRTTPPEPPSNQFKSALIFNEGSALSDHTTYWENIDGFVLQLARICADTANSSLQQFIPAHDVLADDRALWRIRCLRFGNLMSLIGWVAVGLGIWIWHSPSIPALFTPPGWLPEKLVPLARFATLAALIGVAIRCTSALIHFIWNSWRRHEINASFSGDSTRVPTELPLLVLALPYSAILCLAFYAAFDRWHVFADVTQWRNAGIAAVLTALLFCYVQNAFRTPALKAQSRAG